MQINSSMSEEYLLAQMCCPQAAALRTQARAMAAVLHKEKSLDLKPLICVKAGLVEGFDAA